MLNLDAVDSEKTEKSWVNQRFRLSETQPHPADVSKSWKQG
jgi:hypothetical protein